MTKEITLPSGKIAVIKKGRGIDLLNAQKNSNSSDEIPYALIAQLTEVDGQRLVYEDVLELDLEDVLAIQTEITGKTQEKKEVPQKQESQSITSPTVNQ